MPKSLLEAINYPEDLRKLRLQQLPQLANELRDFIIAIVATKEGHLGASLGVAELTIAIHYVFNTPNDILVWDVGHQAYGHKILTGRKSLFHTNRQYKGISGFPKREESEYDTFGVGHSSTSISAALGMAIAAQLNNNPRQHIVVIGDASIASGMAFEALNHAGTTNANLLIILNDNAIGIDPSVGALKNYLAQTTLNSNPKAGNIFEALNLNYFGPVDGHNLEQLITTLTTLQTIKGPRILHVVTKKGKGLKLAEENQVVYHAPGKFDLKTGKLNPKQDQNLPQKFQDVFGKTLVELAKNNPNIIGITPAMPTGSSLKYMMEAFPDRAFDVGIAEQHAVTFAAGLATQGKIVFCTIYSTFLQRAYDQVIHDVCLQKLPVIFCVDRAGLVGEDGATHHGVFDLAYLNCIPNIIIAAPSNEIELRNLLYTSQLGLKLPIAIRYPRGRGTLLNWEKPFKKIKIGWASCTKEGSNIAVLALGTIVNNALQAVNDIAEKHKAKISIYTFLFLKPLNEHLLHLVFKKYKHIITIEEGVINGGFGSMVKDFAVKCNYNIAITALGVPDEFVEQGTVEQLQEQCGISANKIKKLLLKIIK